MQKFKFDKPLVESATPPENINVHWVKKTLSTDEVKEILEFKDDAWRNLFTASFDFSKIGYSEPVKVIDYALAEAQSIYDNWDPNVISYTFDIPFVPKVDTSKLLAVGFGPRVVSIPNLDFSGVTRSLSFSQASNVYNIDGITISALTTLNSTFSTCRLLRAIPLFDTSKVTNMSYMFYKCTKIETIPQFNTSKVTNMSYMFYNCSSLISVPLLDTGAVTDLNDMFTGCTSLRDVGGLKNLGKAFSHGTTVNMSACPLSSESVTNIGNSVVASPVVCIIQVKADVYNTLTDDQKALFTNKGWTIASA